MRTYIWVRTEGSEQTSLMRDRLTTVIRSALLDYPCLKAADPRNTFRVSIDETTMREEFSDTTLLKGDRFMAGAFVGYILEMDETVQRQDIATLSEYDFAAESVGPGQELPTFT